MLKIFVYGTLKPGESNYRYYCDGKVIDTQFAYTLGCLYNLPFGYPAMTPGEQKVQGFLLTFTDKNHLESLDSLEGCVAGRPIDDFSYYRELVKIYNPQGVYLAEAWAYFMTTAQVKMCGGQWEASGIWHS